MVTDATAIVYKPALPSSPPPWQLAPCPFSVPPPSTLVTSARRDKLLPLQRRPSRFLSVTGLATLPLQLFLMLSLIRVNNPLITNNISTPTAAQAYSRRVGPSATREALARQLALAFRSSQLVSRNGEGERRRGCRRAQSSHSEAAANGDLADPTRICVCVYGGGWLC